MASLVNINSKLKLFLSLGSLVALGGFFAAVVFDMKIGSTLGVVGEGAVVLLYFLEGRFRRAKSKLSGFSRLPPI